MGSYKDIESDNRFEVVCICGESGAGKTTLAKKMCSENDYVVLDGDAVRHFINTELGYSLLDRYKNNQIIAGIAEMLYWQGKRVIISTVRADIAYDILTKNEIPCKLIKL